MDLVILSENPEKELFREEVNGRNETHTIEAAEELGSGTREYELIQL